MTTSILSVSSSTTRDHLTSLTAEALRSYAKGLLKEVDDDKAKVYSVAVAGADRIDDEEGDCVSKSLFGVLQRLSADTVLTTSLAQVIDRLADIVAAREVRHG
jgi:hypothetical protein